MMKKRIVVLTGAGVSADSGVPTFRDVDGIWTKYNVDEVCTHEAYLYDRAKVIGFINECRKSMLGKEPNAAHHALKQLEDYYDVTVVTTNIDELHEKAGSSKIIHLHGDLKHLRSEIDDHSRWVLMEGVEQGLNDRHPDTGDLLRPTVVLFNEAVPLIEDAVEIVSKADIMIIIGTSLVVYPSAGLVNYLPASSSLYYVDPSPLNDSSLRLLGNLTEHIQMRAAVGMPLLAEKLIKDCQER